MYYTLEKKFSVGVCTVFQIVIVVMMQIQYSTDTIAQELLSATFLL